MNHSLAFKTLILAIILTITGALGIMMAIRLAPTIIEEIGWFWWTIWALWSVATGFICVIGGYHFFKKFFKEIGSFDNE